MLLSICHETRYDYAQAVDSAQHIAMLRPSVLAHQSVSGYQLDVLPSPESVRTEPDVYGNEQSFFAIQNPHRQLIVTARSTVQTSPLSPATALGGLSGITWEAARERLRYHAGAAYDGATQYSFASPLAGRHEAFVAYAKPSFTPGVPLAAAAIDLMTRIHRDFLYAPSTTTVNTPALQALAQQSGVCQDFAHVMLACLRSLGLAGRYVSGYLLTQPPPGQAKLVGSDASHAWVSVHLPAPEGQDIPSQWLDLCPTNARFGLASPGEDYVTLATGRDYGDVAPLRGVIHGGAGHTLAVAVTVEPLV
jgi:transglutaminase-like putative cysteine protease